MKQRSYFGLALCHAVLFLTVLAGAGMLCTQAAAVDTPQHDAITPVSKAEEWWIQRHDAMNDRVKEGNAGLLFIGDSITQGWEGAGKDVWAEYYGDRNAVNLGIGGDRTQHVLWRLDNGNIDGISPKLAVIMIGTNNASDNAPMEIVDGVTAIVRKLRERLPDMEILLLGIFPRADKEAEINQKCPAVNEEIKHLADGDKVHYMDIGRWFLNDAGELTKEVMPDLLHLNEVSYRSWAEAIEPKVAALLGEVSNTQPPKGFVSLFEGKDLTGWKGLVENPEERVRMAPDQLAKAQAAADDEMRQHWSVDGDTLYFDGAGSHLCTVRPYEDFEMMVDWKIEAGGDSGIYLRGSPQVQIWDPAQWPQGSGGLYNNKIGPADPLVAADRPIGEWNRFRIIMVGEKVTVYLNDTLVVDNVVLENYWNREKPIYPAEQIELQAHGSKVWWKNIFVREIPRGEGWTALFNGKDLSGWEQIGGEQAQIWHASDGILYTEGEGGGWLSTTAQYSDFEIELEFNVPKGGNSGLFIRAPRDGNPAYAGSEVQILDDYDDQYKELQPYQYTGSVYSTAAPSRRVTLPFGTWQKMKVRAEGYNVQVWLNGVQTVTVNLEDHFDKLADHPGLKRLEGYIGLQNHGSRLDFRNLRIRELNQEN